MTTPAAIALGAPQVHVDPNPVPPTPEQLVQEIATILLDWHQLRYGQVLVNQDDTLLQRGGSQGLKIYDNLERDAHASAVLDKRKRAVTSRDWDVVAGGESPDEQQAAELVKSVLSDISYKRICKDALDSNLKGFAVGEVMWKVVPATDGSPARIVVADVIARRQQRYTFDLNRNLRMLVPENLIEGIPLPDKKFIVHRRPAKDGSPFGEGIGSKLFWPVYFKRKGMGFWLVFLDKFASPTPVGKYPAGTDPVDQNKLLSAIRAITQEAGIVIPEQMEIDLLEAAQAADQGSYERAIRYLDEQISEAVLGETLTTTVGSTGGNRALGQVHDDVRVELAEDDSELLCETHNGTLVKWIVDLNMPGFSGKYPKIVRDFEEPEDLGVRATRDLTLRQMGADFTEDYIRETYGDGVIWTPGTRYGQSQPGGDGEADSADSAAAFAESVTRSRGAQQKAKLTISAAAESLSGRPRLLQRRFDAIQALLDETGNFEDFAERLKDLAAEDPDGQFVEALARAGFVAQLDGRTPEKK